MFWEEALMRILMDVDGVLADFLSPCLAIINRLTRSKRTLSELTSWNIFESLKIPQEIIEQVYREMKEPGWCHQLPVQDGAVDGIRRLQRSAEVYAVTSPMSGPTWVHERTLWLERHFPDLAGVIHTEEKHCVAGDVLVDDKTSTLTRWRECHPGGLAIRWRLSTNLSTPFDGWTTDDWEELAREVDSRARTRKITEETRREWTSR
jgi:5'(3')-deoxyribonucleotidase